jgi:hypothetical protein
LLQHNYLLVFFWFLIVEETTTVRTHSSEEKESKTSAMLENRDAKPHDCIRSAAQQRNDAASQQTAANLKSVKGTRKDIPVGDSGLENAIHLKLKKPREGHSAMR